MLYCLRGFLICIQALLSKGLLIIIRTLSFFIIIFYVLQHNGIWFMCLRNNYHNIIFISFQVRMMLNIIHWVNSTKYSFYKWRRVLFLFTYNVIHDLEISSHIVLWYFVPVYSFKSLIPYSTHIHHLKKFVVLSSHCW